MKKLLYIIGGVIVLILIIAIIGGEDEKKEITLEQQLSLSQEQTPQSPQKTEKELTWHDVISFSGNSDKNTQPFLIRGKQWRINWSFQDSGEFGLETNGLFIVNIYRVGESTITGQVSHSGLSESDTDYFYEGEGEFYFKITAYNAESWSMTVEDLY